MLVVRDLGSFSNFSMPRNLWRYKLLTYAHMRPDPYYRNIGIVLPIFAIYS